MKPPPPSDGQARLMWLAASGVAIATLVGLGAGLIWGLAKALDLLSPVLWPIALAGVVAYLLDPVVDFLHGRGMKRPRAIICVFVLAILLVGAFFSSIVPQLVTEARQLASGVPDYTARFEKTIGHWVSHPPPLLLKLIQQGNLGPHHPPTLTTTNVTDLTVSTNAVQSSGGSTNLPKGLASSLDKDTVQNATGWLAKVLPGVGSWLFGQMGRIASWFGILAGLALVPVYTFYFLLEKENISSRWTDYLPVQDSGFKDELVFVLNSINNYLIAFFRGQVLVAICDGVLYGTGFMIVGIPYALLIGVMAMALTMIPFVGAIMTCGTALVIAVVQYGDWLHPLLVLAVFASVQTMEGLFISPRIMGNRVGLHPVMIIIAVMAGTTLLGGLLGGILAIPLTAALRVIMFRYIWKKPAESRNASNTAAPATIKT